MLPDKVIIGCHEYQVIETDVPLVLNGHECSGTIDYANQVIKISANAGEQAKEQIFWHEVVHGLVHYRNVDLKNADEETIVEEIATGLYGMMKANGLLPGQKAGDAS